MKPTIDAEFAALCPPLTAEEYAALESSIVAEGCRDALIVWQGLLVDGHHRLRICEKHNRPFETREIEFPNRAEAKIWIIENQLARRNLETFQRCELILALKPLLVARAKAKQIAGGKSKVPEKSREPVDTMKELGKQAGVSDNTMRKAEVLVAKADEKTKAKLRRGETTINREHKRIKVAERHKELALTPPGEPTGKYRVIYADPPWQYENVGLPIGPAAEQYPVMPLDDICSISVASWAEDNAVLFLWTTSPLIEDAFAVLRAWGFTYKASFVWDKVRHNFGHYNSVRHEFLLIATRGSCVPDNPKLIDSVQTIERTGKHSEKPEEFRKIIETMYPNGARLELFARGKHEGWSVWGQEAK